MEGIITIKASDLTRLFDEIAGLKEAICEIKQNEDNSKAFTLQQAADRLQVCYNTVRKLVQKGELFAKYPGDTTSKAIIPLWSIKAYLKSKENSNQ